MKKQSVVKKSSKIGINTDQSQLLEIIQRIYEKSVQIQTIIHNTILSINSYNKYEIFSNSDLLICDNVLVELYKKTNILENKCQNLMKMGMPSSSNLLFDNSTQSFISQQQQHQQQQHQNIIDASPVSVNEMVNELNTIIEKMQRVMSGFGAKTLDDLFYFCFGAEYTKTLVFEDDIWQAKYNLLVEHFHPISYKILFWRQNKVKPNVQFSKDGNYCTNKMIDDVLQVEMFPQFECYDIDSSTKSLYVKIYGVSLVVHNEKLQNTVIIQGVMDNIMLDCVKNKYVDLRMQKIRESIATDGITDTGIIDRIIETLGLKEILMYGNLDIYKRYVAVLAEVNAIKNSKLNITIKNFLELSIFQQRQMLINLLIYNKEDEIQYITYLLYHLIKIVNAEGITIDTEEQKLIYESFPWKMKLFFKEAMGNTIKYTANVMQKYDMNRVSLEQQIYVMKAPDNVKEKAIMKLKDVKSRGDSESKAQQYLEGLLRIPFGIYREEPILKKIKNANQLFVSTLPRYISAIHSFIENNTNHVEIKNKYTTVEMLKYIRQFNKYIETNLIDQIQTKLDTLLVKELNGVINLVNGFQKNMGRPVITPAKTKKDKIAQIMEVLIREYTFISCASKAVADPTVAIPIDNINIPDLDYDVDEYIELIKLFLMQVYDFIMSNTPELGGLVRINTDLEKCEAQINEVREDIKNVLNILDESIYGHTHAKNQIMKIIGQWMNGEMKGYVFGFEGSPGIGKTSLAKYGLAKCLSDGTSPRPFSFIALGGASNSSFLDGHGFTYLNSTHGKIVDILMESKCMNPIIYIDELDKVSKTEQGKEIIGVLTHLTDPTQNDVFQDKYFSGIDLDLSKALIIFSYNDVNNIDRVLLDRIHRIKFDNLTISEKLVIVHKFLLPELNKKMGFENTVELSDNVIEFIIQEYTTEPGVRKLKEILFDMFGEINLELLNDNLTATELPLKLTCEMIEMKYLHNYTKTYERKVHLVDEVGVANCLWANSLGMGGIMTMKTAFAPSNTFLELKLTGLQSDLMKETMQLAVNVAWEMLTMDKQTELVATFTKTKCQAIHVHMGLFSTKDGPSASALTAICIYSMFMGIPIKRDVAFTGEVDYLGRVNEIGGLEYKIFGAFRAGVKKVIYPKQNHADFMKIVKKEDNKEKLATMEFIEVEHIKEAMPHLLIFT